MIAAALTEIPAVREQRRARFFCLLPGSSPRAARLSEWLGRDVPAATGLAKELLDLAQSEACLCCTPTLLPSPLCSSSGVQASVILRQKGLVHSGVGETRQSSTHALRHVDKCSMHSLTM